MKKSILNLGKALNKAEQREVNGSGGKKFCSTHEDCRFGYGCCGGVCISDIAMPHC
ncbi:hypothetical protein [Tenacibaculum ovolyticum]|uniref:hypothetical protein n=1 Tax=Tenacibaculum ovolyticum TaxID=104270 RepID=UPI001F4560BC|nr:hypothetical protein [Tenacibaculum ovolyticum]